MLTRTADCCADKRGACYEVQDNTTGRMMLRLAGLSEDRNNVYIVNVVARHKETGEKAPYTMLALQVLPALIH